MGFAVAFGTDPKLDHPIFAGFLNGWFADFSQGLSTEGDQAVTQEIFNETYIYNQRRFFVFFAFVVFATNITTSSIGERSQFPAMLVWIIIQ